MLFLIVPGVLIVVPGEDEALEFGLNELPVTALASDNANESSLLQIGNKLANLARHMAEAVTGAARLPMFCPEETSSRESPPAGHTGPHEYR